LCFAFFFQYSYETRAAEMAGVCNGQFRIVKVHKFLWFTWGSVEDGNGNEVSDDCGLVAQGIEKMGWQQ
jgi:hypothetical protein